ncbi:MAG: type II 3-dehydroquinate dehydratase [Saprospiraceae bacterium]|nr:type II 3-dehydroquinate dehydratase [Saprospiraceae bacterium]
MKILIINGPNLNLLGKREPEIYGNISFETYFETLKQTFPTDSLSYFQSNQEGDIIEALQSAENSFDGIVLNGAGFTHTSVAIADAIGFLSIPVVEVHISNIHAREAFRHHSYFSAKCKGVIVGLGLKGYELAIRALQS